MAGQPNQYTPNGLLNRLLNTSTTSLFGHAGTQIPRMDGAESNSTLHYNYSINGIPIKVGKPYPSGLDMDGVTPPKYWDIRPQ